MNLGQHLGELRIALELARNPKIGPIARQQLEDAPPATVTVRTVQHVEPEEPKEPEAPPELVKPAEPSPQPNSRAKGVKAAVRAAFRCADRALLAAEVADRCGREFTKPQIACAINQTPGLRREGDRGSYRYYVACTKADPARKAR